MSEEWPSQRTYRMFRDWFEIESKNLSSIWCRSFELGLFSKHSTTIKKTKSINRMGKHTPILLRYCWSTAVEHLNE